jgi:hypothetical protein
MLNDNVNGRLVIAVQTAISGFFLFNLKMVSMVLISLVTLAVNLNFHFWVWVE